MTKTSSCFLGFFLKNQENYSGVVGTPFTSYLSHIIPHHLHPKMSKSLEEAIEQMISEMDEDERNSLEIAKSILSPERYNRSVSLLMERVSPINFGMYFHIHGFVSLVTAFHKVDNMVWNASALGCLPLSKWVCGKPQSSKTVKEEYRDLEEAMFEAGLNPFEVRINSRKTVKDLGSSIAVWLTSDPRIDHAYITREYMSSPDVVTIQKLIVYHMSHLSSHSSCRSHSHSSSHSLPIKSHVLLVYAKGDHYNVTCITFKNGSTSYKTLSSSPLVRSTLLSPFAFPESPEIPLEVPLEDIPLTPPQSSQSLFSDEETEFE